MTHGRFSGDPETRWLTDTAKPDRWMELLQPFLFQDPDANLWLAKAGAAVNGASIPRALWTVVGSPYTGDYRRASIVHDAACDAAGDDVAKRRAADRMFFHACRAGGCSTFASAILYLGVRVGAVLPLVPAWQTREPQDEVGPRIRRPDADLQLEWDFQELADLVFRDGETDDVLEVERRVDDAFVAMNLPGSGVRDGSPWSASRRPGSV